MEPKNRFSFPVKSKCCDARLELRITVTGRPGEYTCNCSQCGRQIGSTAASLDSWASTIEILRGTAK